MGYGGFGMQKWIYKQRARKPFSNSRGASSENSKFSEGFHVASGSLSREEVNERLDIRKREQFLIPIIFILFIIGIFVFLVPKFTNYEKKYNETNEIILEEYELESFQILRKSGNEQLAGKNFKIAAHEFELAYKIKKDENIKASLIECYESLCNEDLFYCEKLLELTTD